MVVISLILYIRYNLFKLRNLGVCISDTHNISLPRNVEKGTRFIIPFNINEYNTLNILAYEIYGDNQININCNQQSHWNKHGTRTYRYHSVGNYSLNLRIYPDTNELEVSYINIATSSLLYINKVEIWGSDVKYN